jgi:uncharacterized protein YjlB
MDAAMVEPEALLFADDGAIPNNPDLPLLLYRGAVADAAGDPAVFERLFARNRWSGGWRNGIFPYHHYHSTAHEVLGIARGRATVRFGGAEGQTVEVAAGDVVVVPAGVGHKNEGASGDLLVVGAYPDGRGPDLCTGEPGERPQALEAVRRVPLPAADPVAGADGPLMRLWGSAAGDR